MPQLDNLVWFGQVFSLLIVMTVFYLLLSLIFLPGFTMVNKTRYKLYSLRKYCAQFLNMNGNEATIFTRKELTLFFFNHNMIIDSYYQPCFVNEFQDLNELCYVNCENKNYLQYVLIGKLLVQKNDVNPRA